MVWLYSENSYISQYFGDISTFYYSILIFEMLKTERKKFWVMFSFIYK